MITISRYIAIAAILLGIFLSSPTHAQEPSLPIVTSSTQTEWFNSETQTWDSSLLAALQSPSWPQIADAEWIWNLAIASYEQKEEGDVVQFRQSFELPGDVEGIGKLLVVADNEVTAFLNGVMVVDSFVCNFGSTLPQDCILEVPITAQSGTNTLEFTVTQFGVEGSGDHLHRNLAGLVFKVVIEELVDTEPDPIVIVPGMVVSVSPLTTFLNEPSDFWAFTLGARGIYSSLIQQFELSGYFENQDVFIAHYNWRDSVENNAINFLDPMIEKVKQETGSDKVDIVAHSMGGLLARSYIQGDNYENDIDQLIMLGTPHEGAADAYIAWEGGKLPLTWNAPLRAYVKGIELSLKKLVGPDIEAPLSFRTFFPSLKDLLPITNFITKDNNSIPVTSLIEQNNFLQNLQTEIDQLEEKGVDVTAIVGTNISTLGKIAITDSRTLQDEILFRWRDGHPVTEIITPDTLEGDQRVLVSSAQIGQNIITLPGGNHDKLPHVAREKILEILDIEPETFEYEPPDIESLLSIAVLSPVEPTITCGSSVLSESQNTFGEDLAQYIVDSNNSDAPKLLAIGNPPQGECEITLTGTDTGEYTIITTYANDDESISTVREGETTLGKTEMYSVNISQDSFVPPIEDISQLVCRLSDTVKELMSNRHINSTALEFHGIATRMCSFAQNWQKQNNQREWEAEIRSDYNQFVRELHTEIEQNNLDDTAIKELLNLQIEFEEAGWL